MGWRGVCEQLGGGGGGCVASVCRQAGCRLESRAIASSSEQPNQSRGRGVESSVGGADAQRVGWSGAVLRWVAEGLGEAWALGQGMPRQGVFGQGMFGQGMLGQGMLGQGMLGGGEGRVGAWPVVGQGRRRLVRVGVEATAPLDCRHVLVLRRPVGFGTGGAWRGVRPIERRWAVGGLERGSGHECAVVVGGVCWLLPWMPGWDQEGRLHPQGTLPRALGRAHGARGRQELARGEGVHRMRRRRHRQYNPVPLHWPRQGDDGRWARVVDGGMRRAAVIEPPRQTGVCVYVGRVVGARDVIIWDGVVRGCGVAGGEAGGWQGTVGRIVCR
mmetsp:Transcript_13442/g.43073  ORF Transcript_13442/g.43073 Transcript_13442/m.43073 type:complete len:329 (-) Transcript_13442:819-1805(-)